MLKDFLGKELKVGQRITYAVRSGSKMWLCLATILEVHADHLMVNRIEPPYQYPLKVRNLATVIVVKEASNVTNPV